MKNKNNIEVELKFKLEGSVEEFTKKMFEAKVVQPREKEKTTMYDNEEELMKRTNGRLRVRTGHNKALSYKKPITRDGVKKEIEYQSGIKDPEKVKKILATLGYKPISSYKRTRTVWELSEVEVYLDEFSFGNFVEIEGEEERIKEVAKKLGFNMEDNITRSYDGFYYDLCKEKGIKPKKHFK